MLYSGDNNPSPLITLIEQEFARQVAGVVKVYIESETDMAAMRDVLKVYVEAVPPVRRFYRLSSKRFESIHDQNNPLSSYQLHTT